MSYKFEYIFKVNFCFFAGFKAQNSSGFFVSCQATFFELEYLKDGLVKLIVLLVCYYLLSHNFIELNVSSLS